MQEAAHLGVQDSAHEEVQDTAHLNTENGEAGNGNQRTIAARGRTGVSTRRHSPQPRLPRTRLPDVWRPSDQALSFAKQCGLSEEAIPSEVLKFKNYYIGKGILMVDWNRAWQNWCIRAIEYASTGRSNTTSGRSLVAGLWGQT